MIQCGRFTLWETPTSWEVQLDACGKLKLSWRYLKAYDPEAGSEGAAKSAAADDARALARELLEGASALRP